MFASALFNKIICCWTIGVRLSPLGTTRAVWSIVPALYDDDDDECGAIGGMLGR
jgi:hypothetical protein